MNKQSRLGAWIAIIVGTLYFALPLLSTFEFSLRMKREGYSFEAYRVVFSDARFQESFLYSTFQALATIIYIRNIMLIVRHRGKASKTLDR